MLREVLALLGKGAPPEPLSTAEAIVGVALVLVGVLLAVLIAAVRYRLDGRKG